jgi:hypothetical protein
MHAVQGGKTFVIYVFPALKRRALNGLSFQDKETVHSILTIKNKPDGYGTKG